MTSTPPITHPAYTLLARAHSPSTATKIFTDKVKNKPLLLHPTAAPSATDNRALRRHIRERKKAYHRQHAKPRPLSAKETRQLGLNTIPRDDIKYEVYKDLNALWTGYILEVLGFMRDGEVAPDAGKRQISVDQGSLIASADFHGMEVQVVRCRDVGRVGMKGIVVRETKGLLALVMPNDRVVKVLKRGAVFRVTVSLPQPRQGDGAKDSDKGDDRGGSDEGKEGRKLVFDLYGDQLEVRPVDRATRKFKWHPTDLV